MARQRRGHENQQHDKGSASDRRQQRIDEEDGNTSQSRQMSWMWTLLMLVLLGIAAQLTYTGYLETRVTTRFDANKVRLTNYVDQIRNGFKLVW
jgi:hypothetical protein